MHLQHKHGHKVFGFLLKSLAGKEETIKENLYLTIFQRNTLYLYDNQMYLIEVIVLAFV